MNKKELEIAIKNANSRTEVETLLEIVVEKLQGKKTGKQFKEELKKHEEALMEKLDKLEEGEEGEEEITLAEGKYIVVRENSNDKEVVNTFKVVATTDKEIVLQDLTEYVGLHIILKVAEQKPPKLQNKKISFIGEILEVLDELK